MIFYCTRKRKSWCKIVLYKFRCRWKWSFRRSFMLWGYADVNNTAAISMWYR